MKNYSDSENCYGKNAKNTYRNEAEDSYSSKTTDSSTNRAQNARNTKEENRMTDCHKDTTGKNSADQWQNASNFRNAATSNQARNAADNSRR